MQNNTQPAPETPRQRVAYLGKVRGGGYQLTICDRPCNGDEFNAGDKISVSGIRDARKICRERNLLAWNFSLPVTQPAQPAPDQIG